VLWDAKSTIHLTVNGNFSLLASIREFTKDVNGIEVRSVPIKLVFYPPLYNLWL